MHHPKIDVWGDQEGNKFAYTCCQTRDTANPKAKGCTAGQNPNPADNSDTQLDTIGTIPNSTSS